MQSKLQFTSTEVLQIIFPPFYNALTGDYYLGTDTVSLTIKKPNGTLLVGPPTPVYDTDVRLWVATVATGSFAAGQWMVRASSNGLSSLDQQVILTWGDYVEAIPTITTINTKVGTPAAASVSADIANLDTGIDTLLAASATLLSVTDALRKAAYGRWKITGTQLVIYDDDGTTPLETFDLKDPSGTPSNTQIFERVPV